MSTAPYIPSTPPRLLTLAGESTRRERWASLAAEHEHIDGATPEDASPCMFCQGRGLMDDIPCSCPAGLEYAQKPAV